MALPSEFCCSINCELSDLQFSKKVTGWVFLFNQGDCCIVIFNRTPDLAERWQRRSVHIKFRTPVIQIEPLRLSLMSMVSKKSCTADIVASVLPEGVSQVLALSSSSFSSEYL